MTVDGSIDPTWTESVDTHYYWDQRTGRLLGLVFKFAAQNVVWNAKVIGRELPWSQDREYHLGQFMGSDWARRAMEEHWLRETRTLLA